LADFSTLRKNWARFAAAVAWAPSLAAQERGAIDLAFALRLRLGLGTRLFSTVWKIVFHST